MLRKKALLGAALCALVLGGCATGGEQGVGDVAGRQSPGSVPANVTVDTLLNIAERTRAAGDPSAAIGFYRRANAVAPQDVRPLIGLGETLNQSSAANEAAEAFRAALHIAPNDPAALRGLGTALVSLGQPAAGAETLRKALAAAPDPRGFAALGVAEDLVGDYNAAAKAYRQGLELAPDDLALRNNLGLSEALAEQFDAAIETLRGVATDGRASAVHRLNLSLVLGLAGRPNEAAQVARIDLDERSVRSNLAYYAELRALPPALRVQAILNPAAKPGPIKAPEAPRAVSALPPEKAGASPPTEPLNPQVAAVRVARVEQHPLPAIPALGAATRSDAPGRPLPPSVESHPEKDTAPLARSREEPGAQEDCCDVTAHATSTHREIPADTDLPASKQPTVEKSLAGNPDRRRPEPGIAGDAAPMRSSVPQAALLRDAEPPLQTIDPASHTVLEPKTTDDVEPKRPTASQADSRDAEPASQTTDPASHTVIEPKTADDAEPKRPAASPAANSSEGTSLLQTADPALAKMLEYKTAETTTASTLPPTLTYAPGPEPDAPAIGAAPADVQASPAELPRSSKADMAARWVQLGAVRDSAAAEAVWRHIADRNHDLLNGLSYTVRSADLGPDKGVYFRLRVGPIGSTEAARNLCAALKERNVECFVVPVAHERPAQTAAAF
jgi:Flp pilus assembly protein TadD/cell division protein FtsN